MRLNWEIKDGERKYYVLYGLDGNQAALVWKKPAERKKKLNKDTRKYEYIDYPEEWRYRLSIGSIVNFLPVSTEQEALENAERVFLQALDDIEENLSYLKSLIIEPA